MDGKIFAQAAKRSLTNWFEIRRAISGSGNVLKASRIFSAMSGLIRHSERSRGTPLHYLKLPSRGPSTPKAFVAQDDALDKSNRRLEQYLHRK